MTGVATATPSPGRSGEEDYQQYDVTPLEPLGASDTTPSGAIVLVANDKTSRFAVNISVFKSYSKFATDMLEDMDEGEEMPLDTHRAPPHIVQLFATWLHGHAKTLPSKMKQPMPKKVSIDELYKNPWDMAFLRAHLMPKADMCTLQTFNNEDASKVRRMYELALLSVYLQTDPLTKILATFFAFHIRRGVRNTCEPTKLVRGWFGKEGDYELEEIKEMTDWTRTACKDMKLPPKEEEDSDEEC